MALPGIGWLRRLLLVAAVVCAAAGAKGTDSPPPSPRPAVLACQATMPHGTVDFRNLTTAAVTFTMPMAYPGGSAREYYWVMSLCDAVNATPSIPARHSTVPCANDTFVAQFALSGSTEKDGESAQCVAGFDTAGASPAWNDETDTVDLRYASPPTPLQFATWTAIVKLRCGQRPFLQPQGSVRAFGGAEAGLTLVLHFSTSVVCPEGHAPSRSSSRSGATPSRTVTPHRSATRTASFARPTANASCAQDFPVWLPVNTPLRLATCQWRDSDVTFLVPLAGPEDWFDVRLAAVELSGAASRLRFVGVNGVANLTVTVDACSTLSGADVLSVTSPADGPADAPPHFSNISMHVSRAKLAASTSLLHVGAGVHHAQPATAASVRLSLDHTTLGRLSNVSVPPSNRGADDGKLQRRSRIDSRGDVCIGARLPAGSLARLPSHVRLLQRHRMVRQRHYCRVHRGGHSRSQRRDEW